MDEAADERDDDLDEEKVARLTDNDLVGLNIDQVDDLGLALTR